MKRLTSFTHFITAEGSRISYTYSEIDDGGNVLNHNVRENFIVTDPAIESKIADINNFIKARMEG